MQSNLAWYLGTVGYGIKKKQFYILNSAVDVFDNASVLKQDLV